MVEKMLVQMIVRHGEDIIYRDLETDDGNTINLNVAQYIAYDLGQDALSFSNPLFNRILDEAVLHSADEGFKAESFFLNHEDVEISKIANMLSVDQVQLSKSLQLSKDDDGLREQVIHLILDFRMDYVEEHIESEIQEYCRRHRTDEHHAGNQGHAGNPQCLGKAFGKEYS